ncbi:hypothetical protein Leryth_027366 [Lithospermum erythrorhizon]|nr:hypothetical protein Leryth_027366 [Lithospermum erythrorhizon]
MLLELKVDFENTGALDSSWIKGTNPCDQKKKWVGVTCRNDMVRVLRLSGYNLSGEFNVDAISDLKSIRTINIAKNHFSGPIPEFYLIDGLRDLVANGNKFDGEIISTFFATNQRSRLRTIDLSSNNFSGKIPESLASSPPNLKELLLDHNGFSGPVPLFPQQTLKKFNVSFNKLEGEIPKDMVVKFGAEAFAENPGLCSPHIGKECQIKKDANSSSGGSSSIKWIILGVIIAILVITLLLRQKTKQNDLPPVEPGNIEHGGMHMHGMSRSRNSSRNMRGGPLISNSAESNPQKGSHSSREGGELIIVNDERGTFGLPDLMKAAAEVLGNGTLGSAYKAVMVNGVSVVVKRLRDMNKMHRDEFYMEMRHLGGLRHKNILPPLAYLYKKEEKLIVSEYVPRGSLLYLLHGNRGIAHSDLTWPTRLKIIKGAAQGMTFLHSEFPTYELPHGNLKSSNILLSADFEPLLSDYAFQPMFNSTQAGTLLFACQRLRLTIEPTSLPEK